MKKIIIGIIILVAIIATNTKTESEFDFMSHAQAQEKLGLKGWLSFKDSCIIETRIYKIINKKIYSEAYIYRYIDKSEYIAEKLMKNFDFEKE